MLPKTASPEDTFDGSPNIYSLTFEWEPLSVSVNGYMFALVELCRETLAQLTKVNPGLAYKCFSCDEN